MQGKKAIFENKLKHRSLKFFAMMQIPVGLLAVIIVFLCTSAFLVIRLLPCWMDTPCEPLGHPDGDMIGKGLGGIFGMFFAGMQILLAVFCVLYYLGY